METMLSDTSDINLLKQERTKLESKMDEILSVYESLNELCSEPDAADNEKFERFKESIILESRELVKLLKRLNLRNLMQVQKSLHLSEAISLLVHQNLTAQRKQKLLQKQLFYRLN